MSSLIKAGSLAEACTKIYGFRVDSVYNNVKSTYLRLKENDGKFIRSLEIISCIYHSQIPLQSPERRMKWTARV